MAQVWLYSSVGALAQPAKTRDLISTSFLDVSYDHQFQELKQKNACSRITSLSATPALPVLAPSCLPHQGNFQLLNPILTRYHLKRYTFQDSNAWNYTLS